jgi:hypothetical protein
MTANDNPILAFFAFVCLAAVIFLAIAFIGFTFYEQYTAKQCLTAYERRARAKEAPDDYFGRQLREAAPSTCAALRTGSQKSRL